MHTTASVTSALQRLFCRQPQWTTLFRPLSGPEPERDDPLPPHADFMDTRPLIFRSEGFDEELLPTRGRA